MRSRLCRLSSSQERTREDQGQPCCPPSTAIIDDHVKAKVTKGQVFTYVVVENTSPLSHSLHPHWTLSTPSSCPSDTDCHDKLPSSTTPVTIHPAIGGGSFLNSIIFHPSLPITHYHAHWFITPYLNSTQL